MDGKNRRDKYYGGGDAANYYHQQQYKSKECVEGKESKVVTHYKWSAPTRKLPSEVTSLDRGDGDSSIHVQFSAKKDEFQERESSFSNKRDDKDDNIVQSKENELPEALGDHGSNKCYFQRPIEDTKKFKIDEDFFDFVQLFTEYCERRTHLIFDDSTFYDDDSCFPNDLILTDYIPVIAVAPKVKALEIQVPTGDEFCKFVLCSKVAFDYFNGNDEAKPSQEMLLRGYVGFILNTLQCPALHLFSLETFSSNGKLSEEHLTDRMLEWNESLISFISTHRKTLKIIDINATRSKSLSGKSSQSNMGSVRAPAKTSFPILEELSVILGDVEESSPTSQTWTPDWFPDAVDQYWISMMRSQIHGKLTRLCWNSAANLNWDQIFQPIIEANQHTLKFLHVVEAKNSEMDCKGTDTVAFTISTSATVLTCEALKNLKKLKELSLRKSNCFLVGLKHLPKSLESLAIDNIKIESKELVRLRKLNNLKLLRLADNYPHQMQSLPYGLSKNLSQFGVGVQELRSFLSIRTLNELCVWNHCLCLIKDEGDGLFQNVFGKMNEFVRAKIGKSSQNPKPGTKSKKSIETQAAQTFVKELKKVGFLDEECFIVSDKL